MRRYEQVFFEARQTYLLYATLRSFRKPAEARDSHYLDCHVQNRQGNGTSTERPLLLVVRVKDIEQERLGKKMWLSKEKRKYIYLITTSVK